MTPKKYERRHIRKNGMYGWQEGKAWWDYIAPSYFNGSGSDKAGWGGYRVAIIYEGKHANGQHFLAIFEGCHWEIVTATKTWERRWGSIWEQFATLEAAMDFCENLMVEHGVLPPFNCPYCHEPLLPDEDNKYSPTHVSCHFGE